MAKPRRKQRARLSDRDELLAQFCEWRKAEGLPFDPAYVPRSFANIKDLDDGYAEIESAVKAAREVPRSPGSAPPVPTYSKSAVDKKFDDMLLVIGKWCGQKISEALLAAITPMRERIQELENREYGGAWRPGRTYAKSSIVSHDGSGWIALTANPTGRPGTEDSGWKLFIKRGRDAPRERTRP